MCAVYAWLECAWYRHAVCVLCVAYRLCVLHVVHVAVLFIVVSKQYVWSMCVLYCSITWWCLCGVFLCMCVEYVHCVCSVCVGFLLSV